MYKTVFISCYVSFSWWCVLSAIGVQTLKHYTPYSARMSPENTHKFMGLYMILGAILQYTVFAYFL